MFRLLLLGCAFSAISIAEPKTKKPFHPVIPHTWDDAAMADLELPLPKSEYSLRQVSADYYYRIPVRPIYKTFPVYARDREPAGYLERLRNEEPAIVFDPARLKTELDWVRAGELVFDAPIALDSPLTIDATADPAFLKTTAVPLAPDGTIPTLRYVIRKKGVVQMGSFSCGMCHTRVQPDGSLIKGAQGNFPGDRAVAFTARRHAARDLEAATKEIRYNARSTFQLPWAQIDPLHETWFSKPIDQHLAAFGRLAVNRILVDVGSDHFARREAVDMFTRLMNHASAGGR